VECNYLSPKRPHFVYCRKSFSFQKLVKLILFIGLAGVFNDSLAQLKELEYRVKGLDSLMNTYSINYEKAENEANKLYKVLERGYTGKKYQELKVRVMLQKSILFSLDSQHQNALKIALEALDIANNYELPERIYECSWVLAIIFEVVGDYKQCKKYLDNAYALSKKHNLDHLYSVYCIRLSSYYKLTSKQDSAIHYANIALEYAQRFNNIREERDAYLLLGSLIAQKNYKEAVQYRLMAAQKFIEISDLGSAAHQYSSVSNILRNNNHLEEAIAYSDSAMKMAFYAKKKNIANVYLSRSKLFESLKNADSSFYYFKQYHEAYVDDLKRMERAAIKKIDEQFQNNKNQAIIKNRSLGLIFSIIISLVVAVFAFVLFRKNRWIKAQNVLIDNQLVTLKEVLDQKQKHEESKNKFFANASHELKTPLALILGPLETVLKNGSLDENERNRLLGIAQAGGQTLNNLVKQILDIGKLDVGNIEIDLKPTKVRSFFDLWLSHFESLGMNKNVKYSVENNVPEKLVALLDHEKCRQIVSNLVSNAFKFNISQGEVRVSINAENENLTLIVSDTGQGIDPSDLPYIFNRYFQGGKREEQAQGGMGIGLSLCKDYVELLGGSIQVESILNQGSKFIVRLPLKTSGTIVSEDIFYESEINHSLTVKNAEKDSTIKPTILVVEDNQILQSYLEMLLIGDYNILLAENGSKALDLVAANKQISLIISDLMMPVMDGYKLLNALKSSAKTEKIPVIMLTAREEKDARLKALKVGVDDYMTKPFSEEELKVRIENLLKKAEIRKKSSEELGDDLTEGILTEDNAWLSNFDNYIKGIYLNHHINIPEIAIEFAMSESGLLRKLKRLTGHTPQQYIQELRLQEGYLLLRRGTHSVQTVAYKMGYKDPRTFSRAFKNRFGTLPSDIFSS
jgi:signal transduction histidine kinase/CheY-like chemotaxis protein/AraC-like DNA-binding protein